MKISEFNLGVDEIQKIQQKMYEAIQKGLSGFETSLKMLNTFIQNTKFVNLENYYYGIEFGASYLKFAKVKFERRIESEIRVIKIPNSLKVGHRNKLFEFIVKEFDKFIYENGGYTFIPSIGFTVDFPVDLLTISVGYLVRWTKDMFVEKVVNKDIGMILKKAIQNNSNIFMNQVKLLNDTTGTLLSAAASYNDDRVKIAVVLKEGFNICYFESTKNVLFTNFHSGESILLNTECGAFGDHDELKEFLNDHEIHFDKNSLAPGYYRFEKLVSEPYIIEMTNKILKNFKNSLDTYENKKLTIHDVVDFLENKNDAIFKSFDNIQSYMNCKKIIEALCIRCAKFVGTIISAVIKQINEKSVTIAVDSFVIQSSFLFFNTIKKTIEILVPTSSVHFIFIRNGGVIGAALCASLR